MRDVRMPLAVIVLAAAAASLPAQSELDLAVSAADLAAPLAAISVDFEVGDERALGDDGAVRWRLGAGGSLVPADRSISGSDTRPSVTASARWFRYHLPHSMSHPALTAKAGASSSDRAYLWLA